MFRIGTWNVRFFSLGTDSPRRLDRIVRMIRALQVDLLCLQEVGPELLAHLHKQLPGYIIHSAKRYPRHPHSETLVILVRNCDHQTLDWSQFWFGPEPQRSTPAWDALVPRVFLGVQLERDDFQTPLFVGNCHLDHLSHRSRLESARTLSEHIRQLGARALLAGDFNANIDNSVVQQLCAGPPRLVDSRQSSCQFPGGPGHTWQGLWPLRRRIDLILHDAALLVDAHRTHAFPRRWRPPSDHLPVTANLVPCHTAIQNASVAATLEVI